MSKQIRMNLTLSEEEDRAFNEAYARYLLGSDEHLSRNKWLIRKVKEGIENEVQ